MLCKKCLTDNYVAGQAFRDWKCENCGKTFIHHNTHVPKYCPECSEKLNKCEQCGRPLSE